MNLHHFVEYHQIDRKWARISIGQDYSRSLTRVLCAHGHVTVIFGYRYKNCCCSRYYELAGLLRELEAVKKSKELNEIAKVHLSQLPVTRKLKRVNIQMLAC